MNKVLVLIMMLFIISCEGEEGQFSNDLCTLLGSYDSLQVEFTSTNPLPEKLMFDFNDGEIVISECMMEDKSVKDHIEFNADRTSGVLTVYSGLKVLFKHGKPISDSIDVNLFYTKTCADTKSYIDTQNNQKVEWKAVYANGKDCGKTSNSGKSQVDFIY